ncbi:MAG: ROK family protein [Treponema sp.]|jgi:glucokinase|nr:ROK family protein [Treponema sp.]
MEKYTIGIDIGGTKVAYGLLDSKSQIIRRVAHPSNSVCSAEDFFNEVTANILKIMSDYNIKKENLLAVGIGLPSFVLFEEGRIIKTSNLTNIHDFPVRDYLMKKLGGIKVIIDNDAHTAAIAEHRHGAGRGFKNMLYCPVSTGISTGIIINGSIFRGNYGWAGESGHMIVTPDEGIECGCGNRGCLMSWCSGSMIIKHIKKWIEAGEKSSITDIAGNEQINCNHLALAYNAGDLLARRAIAQMVKFLGVWTYNLYTTLNINCFVFGGGLLKMFRELKDKESNSGENSGGLLSAMKETFDKYNKNPLPVYFKEAELSNTMSGDDFGIIGAAELLF